MAETDQYVHVETAEKVATITLDRPEARNAMFPPLSRQLRNAVDDIHDSDTRVAVIRGSDDAGAFCAGGDLDVGPEEFMEDVDLIHDVIAAIYEGPVPFIAEIDGAAMGGGLELAAACDLRLVSTDATLGVPEVSIGVFPAAGGTRLLPRLVGTATAKDLVLTGRHISGSEAAEMGLATRAVPSAQLEEEVQEVASTLAAHSPAALTAAIESIHDAFDRPVVDGLHKDRDAAASLVHSENFEEGTAAFLDGRDPEFPDRT